MEDIINHIRHISVLLHFIKINKSFLKNEIKFQFSPFDGTHTIKYESRSRHDNFYIIEQLYCEWRFNL